MKKLVRTYTIIIGIKAYQYLSYLRTKKQAKIMSHGTTINKTLWVIPGQRMAGTDDANTDAINTIFLVSNKRCLIDLSNINKPRPESGIKKFSSEPKLFTYSINLDE